MRPQPQGQGNDWQVGVTLFACQRRRFTFGARHRKIWSIPIRNSRLTA